VFRETTATLLDEVKNLNRIVSRFSDFSRMPAPSFEIVDVNQIARSVLKLYEPQIAARGNITIVAEIASSPLPAETDPEQLRRPLGNLMLNAIDAMNKGGTLSMRTAKLEDSVRIEVSDTGQGLTEEERERLFTPYYTTKQHGTGLGLAIVQSVISDHGGRISVQSEPGKGSTFRIALPAAS